MGNEMSVMGCQGKSSWGYIIMCRGDLRPEAPVAQVRPVAKRQYMYVGPEQGQLDYEL